MMFRKIVKELLSVLVLVSPLIFTVIFIAAFGLKDTSSVSLSLEDQVKQEEVQTLLKLNHESLTIHVQEIGPVKVVRIYSSQATMSSVFSLQKPNRLVVDFAGDIETTNLKRVDVAKEIKAIRVGRHRDKTRVVVDLGDSVRLDSVVVRSHINQVDFTFVPNLSQGLDKTKK